MSNRHVGGYAHGQLGKFFGQKISRFLGIEEKLVDYLGWRYHVVLEYQGRIYDLDNTNQPRPVNGQEYLRTFFMTPEIIDKRGGKAKGNRDDLLVFVIPGERYLLTNPEYLDENIFHSLIFSENSPQPLVPYLEGTSD